MKLSILLITYNQEKYIGQCLDSILMQNIPFEFEIVVADDYSGDNTLTIIKNKLKGRIKNQKILDSNKNVGISKNYQRSFLQCDGEYIAVMEGDDYWIDPNRLIKHIEFLDFHKQFVMSMNRMVIFDERTNKMSCRKWNENVNFQLITTQEMALGNKLGNLSACVFRKNEIDKIKPDLYDLRIADWMLGLVLSENGPIAILEELMSVYRVNNYGEWSKLNTKAKNQRMLKLISDYNKYLGRRYDREFRAFERSIKNPLTASLINLKLIDFIPPIIIQLLKLIFPKPIVIVCKYLIVKSLNFSNFILRKARQTLFVR